MWLPKSGMPVMWWWWWLVYLWITPGPDNIHIVISLGQCTPSLPHNLHLQTQSHNQRHTCKTSFLKSDYINVAIIRWEGGFQKEGKTNLQVARVMVLWWLIQLGAVTGVRRIFRHSPGLVLRHLQATTIIFRLLPALNDLWLSKPQPVFGQNY